jgi:hypothetical protein
MTYNDSARYQEFNPSFTGFQDNRGGNAGPSSEHGFAEFERVFLEEQKERFRRMYRDYARGGK